MALESKEVILLPRAGADERNYKGFKKKASGYGYHVRYLVGYYGSVTNNPEDIHGFTKILEQFISGPTIIVAESIGAIHAMHYAVLHPEMVLGVCLSNPAFIKPELRFIAQVILKWPGLVEPLFLANERIRETSKHAGGVRNYTRGLQELTNFIVPKNVPNTYAVIGKQDKTKYLTTCDYPTLVMPDGEHALLNTFASTFIDLFAKLSIA